MNDASPSEPSASQAPDLDVIGSFEHLKDALFRYYDTPFGLADKQLQEERRLLFDRDGGAWRRPLIEVRPQYVTSGMSIADSVHTVGAHPDLAELVKLGLLHEVPSLYEHQHRALAAAVRDNRDVVVTAGTGSGKTESFLLPILADLIRESESWTPASLPVNRWWPSPNGDFQAQRTGERGRHAAVRALVLYPMNALVDDQMMRLRKALDSDGVREWLARRRPGHRFYFGRYTGATPVPGEIGSPTGVRTLREEFAESEKRSRRAQSLEGDARYFIPRLDGGEMRSRWDMLQAPPDIMITNYSMLNVMLMRPRESAIFEKTRRWLDEVPDARFTLVVDELHMYRGTAGTEIAYLLRNLRHRLGLDHRPDKFRVMAASASLEAPRDLDFLQEFFGVERDRFEVLGGRLVLPADTATDVSGFATEFAQLSQQPDPTESDELLARSKAGEALTNALRDGDRLTSDFDTSVSDRLFPAARDASQRRAAMSGVLAALRTTTLPDAPRLRGHLFFRNIPGVWACSDPTCSAIARESESDRTVGKLYSRPTSRCDCGSRVLELLYCQNCGDVFLGGYAPESAFKKRRAKGFEAGLLADLPDLDSLPDNASLGANAANYVVYWPRTREPSLDKHDWTSSSDKGAMSAEFEFKRSSYDPRTGTLRNHRNHTGWSFHVSIPETKRGHSRLKPENLPAAPTRCPACNDNWEIRNIGSEHFSLSDPRRLRTPVRSMRTGFEKVNQVLTTGIFSQLTHRQAVVFSDSRQDAAKLAAGLGLRHYQDLQRLLLAKEVTEQGEPVTDLATVQGYYRKDVAPPIYVADAKAARSRLRARDRETYDAWEKLVKSDSAGGLDDLDDTPAPETEADLHEVLSRVPSLDSHAATVAEHLVHLGVNPGGPGASLQRTQYQQGSPASPWSSLYRWPDDPDGKVRDESSSMLSERQRNLRDEIWESLRRELLMGLFGSAGRDFESLGLGWLTLSTDKTSLDAPRSSNAALIRGSLRVLGHLRRFAGLRTAADAPPRPLRDYWRKIAEASGGGSTAEDVQRQAEQAWGNAVVGYVIQPEHVALRHGENKAWTCGQCTRRHLHPGTGICTKCGTTLPNEAIPFNAPDDDYYAWMANNGTGNFRLNTAELTGQTDRIEAQGRQARFQGVLLDETEKPRPDTLDVLSVTTTMEAGVDIGPLSVVLMANMPPTRFNYQQRVGRAGRRGSPVALALTVCRGRSHDEHYFQDPKRITDAPTPAPYLSTEMEDIYRRVLASEVLRRAFDATREASSDESELDPTRNVHGRFGLAQDWTAVRFEIEAWITSEHRQIRALADALAAHTRGTGMAEDAILWITEGLISRVTAVAEAPHGHQDLSQRLAEAGVLPMFGFPTSARYLYTRKPIRSYPWPPPGVVDRSLDIAIAQFAPGAETVKDGSVHTALGVAAYEPTGRDPRAVSDPLGEARHIGMCRACGHLDEDAKPRPESEAHDNTDVRNLPCPACEADDGSFREIPLRQPAGFFTGGKPRDFDGNFSWRARSLSPRTAADLETGAPLKHIESRLVVHAGKGRRYAVNDNSGRLFHFSPAKATGKWSGALVEAEAASVHAPWLSTDTGTDSSTVSTAIGAVQHTDLFLLGPTSGELPELGLRLNLASVPQVTGFPDDRSGRRAAWYSLAALLRVAAGDILQVQPNEIAAGIHGAGSAHNRARTFAFLSDTLDNGAGYCTHLAEPDVFRELMTAARQMLERFRTGNHGKECGGSCYECLRDYTNMAYHSLLDWRLAEDLLSILSGRTSEGIRPRQASRLLTNWSSDFAEDEAEFVPDLGGAGPAVLFEGRLWVTAKSPFEATDSEMNAARIIRVRQAAAADKRGVPDVVFVDDFLLDKAPSRVNALVTGFEGP
ncbi:MULTISPECIES: DEAD/DEAH box helicase [unclassified Streptomyces]|uniref:DEAD/DEAH box helicase n=1 Tax=unclassified Streptomyces TaxID=2593676 RepID=UPI00278BF1B2|nr:MULTISPECIES: DEAD/DEAH box helicase [unclassified Streptomyces]